jgi:hypothetical protein
MPFQRLGHYRFAELLRGGNSMECYCNTAGERVIFEITAIPSYGHATVARVGRAG